MPRAPSTEHPAARSSPNGSRRRWLAGTAALAAGGAIGSAAARVIPAAPQPADAQVAKLGLTPSATEGPFRPIEWPSLPSASLFKPGASTDGAMRLRGRLLDERARPLADARIELWQCDRNGRYHHPGDGRAQGRDPGFAGFGWVTTDAQGRWEILVLRPVPYPGRTPHIHIAARASGSPDELVTQLYMPDEQQRNGDDFLFRRLGRRAPLVLATLGADDAQFDIVIED